MPRHPRKAPQPPSAHIVVDAAPRTAPVVKSANRVLRVLEYFDEVQREIRVGEIAERLDCPHSSTSVLLKGLVQLGYLDYEPKTRTFLPTARVALLGSWIGNGLVRDGQLAPLMDELSRETGETIILAARNGIFAQYIRVIQATNAIQYHVPVGSRRLLIWSATGFALLSRAEDGEIRDLVRRTNAEAPAGQRRVDIRQVLANVDRFRREGHFFSRELVTPGAGLISMLLPEDASRPDQPFAIGVAGRIEHLDRHETHIVHLMRETLRPYV